MRWHWLWRSICEPLQCGNKCISTKNKRIRTHTVIVVLSLEIQLNIFTYSGWGLVQLCHVEIPCQERIESRLHDAIASGTIAALASEQGDWHMAQSQSHTHWPSLTKSLFSECHIEPTTILRTLMNSFEKTANLLGDVNIQHFAILGHQY